MNSFKTGKNSYLCEVMQRTVSLLLGIFLSALIVYGGSFYLTAANKIRGYIFDERNEPVIGANVYWEKSNKGVTSDINGYFEIDAPGDQEHLIITYTGYEPQSLHIHDVMN